MTKFTVRHHKIMLFINDNLSCANHIELWVNVVNASCYQLAKKRGSHFSEMLLPLTLHLSTQSTQTKVNSQRSDKIVIYNFVSFSSLVKPLPKSEVEILLLHISASLDLENQFYNKIHSRFVSIMQSGLSKNVCNEHIKSLIKCCNHT